MCRLLGYLGPTIQLDRLVCQPEHSLIVQSYKPREMKEAILNADGFGIGWYDPQEDTEPFTYRNIQPIWSDINLPQLARYIKSNTILGYVRSATPGQAVDLSNCQPFTYKNLLFGHNGYIDNFRKSLYRPLRSRLQDIAYETVKGSTDSEHIFGLLIDELTAGSNKDMETAILAVLKVLTELATLHQVKFLANTVITDGHQLIATRFAKDAIAPTLYWLKDDPNFPEAVIVASEPLFEGKWNLCPEQSIITVGENLDIHIDRL
jgi:glutamine amidotransferase